MKGNKLLWKLRHTARKNGYKGPINRGNTVFWRNLVREQLGRTDEEKEDFVFDRSLFEPSYTINEFSRRTAFEGTAETVKMNIDLDQSIGKMTAQDAYEILHTAVTSYISDQDLKPTDQIQLIVRSDKSATKPWSYSSGMHKLDNFSFNKFMGEVEAIIQSNEEIILDGLQFELISIQMPSGAGKLHVYHNSDICKKQCVVMIKNKDEICCARAIVTAKAKSEKHKQYSQIKDGRSIQSTLAKSLHSETGVAEGVCSLEEIEIFGDTFNIRSF